MRTRGARAGGRFDRAHGSEFGQHRLGAETVRILEHAMAGQDLHLDVRKNDGEEMVCCTSRRGRWGTWSGSIQAIAGPTAGAWATRSRSTV